MFVLSQDFKDLQRQPSARPYVQVHVQNWVGSAPRPRWVRLYTGAEPDEPGALAIPSNGSLVRLRIASTTLYRQVVASPGETSDFATWTSWRAATRLPALAATGSELRAFAVDDVTPTQIYESVSTDHGATWSAWSLLETATGTVATISAAAKSDGTFLLIWSVGATLYRKKRSAGAWGTAAAWPNTVNGITGVSVAYRNDWNIVLTGTEQTTTNPTVWQLLYGDGYSQTADTWSGLTAIFPATTGSNLVFDSPWLATDLGRDWLTYGENYTAAGGYNRNWWSHNVGDFVNAAWTEPAPFNQTNNHQLALAYHSSASGDTFQAHLWASTPFGVWRADVAAPILDLTADLLEYEVRETPWTMRGTIDLDNSSGKFNAPGAGVLAALHLGSRVRHSFGYRRPDDHPTTAGSRELWVHSWEHDVAPGRAVLRLHVRGPADFLDGIPVRSSRQWAAGASNVFQIAVNLLGRGGMDYATYSASPQFTSLQPAFTVHPGESVLDALKRLFAKIPDRIFFTSWQSATSLNPQTADASLYSYGPAAHPVESLQSHTRALDPNYVQTLAGSALGEAIDWTSLEDVYLRAAVEQDKTLTTEAQADDRASAALRRAQLEASPGRLTVRTNCAHELFDVIDITEPRAALTAAKRRIMAITWLYQPKKGRYHQVLELGAV